MRRQKKRVFLFFLFLFLNQGDKNLPNLFESNLVNKKTTTTNTPT